MNNYNIRPPGPWRADMTSITQKVYTLGLGKKQLEGFQLLLIEQLLCEAA